MSETKELRANISVVHMSMLDKLAEIHGYTSKTARADTLAFLIADAHRRDVRSNKPAHLFEKAARILTRLKNWPSPITGSEIEGMSFSKNGSVTIQTRFSGQPYKLRDNDWDET